MVSLFWENYIYKIKAIVAKIATLEFNAFRLTISYKYVINLISKNETIVAKFDTKNTKTLVLFFSLPINPH